MANPGVHILLTGGQTVLAACGAMVVYGFIRVRRAVSALSACDMDGCELRRMYSEFKTEVETLRQVNVPGTGSGSELRLDIDQDVLEAFFNETPPEDKSLLH